jgi:hypothetical protein
MPEPQTEPGGTEHAGTSVVPDDPPEPSPTAGPEKP